MKGNLDISKLYDIMSNRQFLALEGLGNEVPFFIHAYDIKNQPAVYDGVYHLYKRLNSNGIETLKLGLYDMVLEVLEEQGYMGSIFDFEKENTKDEFMAQFKDLFNKEDVVAYINKKLESGEYRIVMIYQVGEVFPYLRTHDLLNWIQSTITTHPVVTFFPGDYVMSREIGFNLNLFGLLPGPYYRAFRLDEYMLRSSLK